MDNEQQKKIITLLQFIRELSMLKTTVIKNIDKEPWFCFFDKLPHDETNIVLNYHDHTDKDSSEQFTNSSIFSIRKPEFFPCPQPSNVFKSWLRPGWDRYLLNAEIKSPNITAKEYISTEKFNDSPLRIRLYYAWLKQRTAWAMQQRQIHKVRRFFVELYQLYASLQRDNESFELMLGNGILINQDAQIRHPLFLKKVKLTFDPEFNIITICDTDTPPELFTALLNDIDNINHAAVQQIKENLSKKHYHPLDRHDTYYFLKTVIHSLCPESVFLSNDETIPENAQDKLVLLMKPIFFVRKKVDGIERFINMILTDIKHSTYLPTALLEIIGTAPAPHTPSISEKSLAEKLAQFNGEDKDILLIKPANREQLTIAQKIEHNDAVLVQGPPGTGKTYTIANLLGHFLAAGKTVLVTSYTKKALQILKEQVPKDLQDLCVSILDESNEDIEKSIDGITEHLSRDTVEELQEKAIVASQTRAKIISELTTVRKELYNNTLTQYTPIEYDGKSLTAAAIARFVSKYADGLNYIPGKVKAYAALPLSFSELTTLYRSNTVLTQEDESTLLVQPPNPTQFISPGRFYQLVATINAQREKISRLAKSISMHIKFDDFNKKLLLEDANGRIISLTKPEDAALKKLSSYIQNFDHTEEWMIAAAAVGKTDNEAKKNWETLLEGITNTCYFAEGLTEEMMELTVKFNKDCNFTNLIATIEEMRKIFQKNDRIPHWQYLLHNRYKKAEEMIEVNGHPVFSAQDCTAVLHMLQLREMRQKCAVLWDKLLATYGVPQFMTLNEGKAPEIVAKRMIKPIKRYLNWYANELPTLLVIIKMAGLKKEEIFYYRQFASELENTKHIFTVIPHLLVGILQIQTAHLLYYNAKKALASSRANFTLPVGTYQGLISNLSNAFNAYDSASYEQYFGKLQKLYAKFALLKERQQLLNKLAATAPQWADSIRKRNGIHGDGQVPRTIEDAWHWKQYETILHQINANSLDKLQEKNTKLGYSYRHITNELVKYSAWQHLLERTNHKMRQSLLGWQQTIKKIGKGTGKNAAHLRTVAKNLMIECQKTVPAWIMILNDAINNFVPGKTTFDVLIIDEASQADICALPLFYLAKKIIIVGDDKQVSPVAANISSDKINALISMYIKDNIPNWQLYTTTSSVYDIAKTSFQPLMLLEHFRCLPSIIGYSNNLCYNNKIQPLRDSNDCKLQPTIVNYHVNGSREDKINKVEANAIAALLLSCLQLPEYEDKTFGVISLLGSQQADYIFEILIDKLSPEIIESKHILCGDAYSFQGDERDIIFLSLVDSNDTELPLRTSGTGIEESIKKRYNVAASRAKDQLFIVHSLDKDTDLKEDDIRKSLLDYAANPVSCATTDTNLPIPELTEAVANDLSAQHYHLIKNRLIGNYRLDIVVTYMQEKVAIQCDSIDAYSNIDIAAKVQLQIVLERLGWRFIHIRGSEYYLHPQKTVEDVTKKLQAFGILPSIQPDNSQLKQILLREIQKRTDQYIEEWSAAK